jgi:hypothetical protein
MAWRPKIPKMLEDKAVPDGASSMGDDWTEAGGSVSGGDPAYQPPPPPVGSQYQAFCWTCKEMGYFDGEWSGEPRISESQAQHDSEQHYADFGHYAQIRTV